MDEKTRERIFEPFFTTKETGKGTGLGLATVYGIVRQLEGFINVYSEPGQGTVFRIYLPLVSCTSIAEETIPDDLTPFKGTETILLAEDNQHVREIAEAVLTEAGYKVFSARDGEEALCIFFDFRDSIDLLVLDGIMPEKNGVEVFRKALEIRQNIKAILLSGYTSDILAVNGYLEKGMRLLQKPVRPRELLAAIRDILDRQAIIMKSRD